MNYPDVNNFNNQPDQRIMSGFIAQEVETAAEELGYDFSGVDNPKGESDFYGLRYASFVVPIVKSIQEIDENQKTQEELMKMIMKLTERIEQLEAALDKKQSSN